MDYKSTLIQRILDQPASICPEPFQDFTIRGENQKKIEWNSDMLIDSGMPIQRLQELCTLLENTAVYKLNRL